MFVVFFSEADIAIIIALGFMSIFIFGLLFLFYYFARYVEELYVKNKSLLIKIIFYYILPTAFYLLLYWNEGHSTAKYIYVIIASFAIRYLMDFIYKKEKESMNKKAKSMKNQV
jgi:hypothetical protein